MQKKYYFILGTIIILGIIIGIYFLTFASNIWNDTKVTSPILVSFSSSENIKDYSKDLVVAPGDEFEMVLQANCGICSDSKAGEVQVVFERIDSNLEIMGFEVNQSINLKIPFSNHEVLSYNKIKIKVKEKGYHVIKGKSTLLNSQDYFPNITQNFFSEFSIDICVVDNVEEIKELCAFDPENQKYTNYFATNRESVQYIGSIKRKHFPENTIFYATVNNT